MCKSGLCALPAPYIEFLYTASTRHICFITEPPSYSCLLPCDGIIQKFKLFPPFHASARQTKYWIVPFNCVFYSVSHKRDLSSVQKLMWTSIGRDAGHETHCLLESLPPNHFINCNKKLKTMTMTHLVTLWHCWNFVKKIEKLKSWQQQEWFDTQRAILDSLPILAIFLSIAKKYFLLTARWLWTLCHWPRGFTCGRGCARCPAQTS